MQSPREKRSRRGAPRIGGSHGVCISLFAKSAGFAALLCALVLTAGALENDACLTVGERAIVGQPFAPERAQPLLRSKLAALESRHQTKLLLPHEAAVKLTDHVMGWKLSDWHYYQSIPRDARALPSDLSRLPHVRFTNSQLGGQRVVSLAVGPHYDYWLLKDPRHHLDACISVDRATRRVYFMEVGQRNDGSWGYKEAFDNCYSCHASGPRVVRPLDASGVDRVQLERFNARILAYHACDFGDAVDPAIQGSEIDDAACGGCHNGRMRGRLYRVHQPTITFKTDFEQTMPLAAH